MNVDLRSITQPQLEERLRPTQHVARHVLRICRRPLNDDPARDPSAFQPVGSSALCLSAALLIWLQDSAYRSRQTIPVFPLLRHGRIKCGPTARMADRAVLIELT